MPFSTISNISISIIYSNSTAVFFKDACCAYPGAEKNDLDQVHIF